MSAESPGAMDPRVMLVQAAVLALVARMVSRVTVAILGPWAALVFAARLATKESKARRATLATLAQREIRAM